jgi:hypothetical protein
VEGSEAIEDQPSNHQLKPARHTPTATVVERGPGAEDAPPGLVHDILRIKGAAKGSWQRAAGVADEAGVMVLDHQLPDVSDGLRPARAISQLQAAQQSASRVQWVPL